MSGTDAREPCFAAVRIKGSRRLPGWACFCRRTHEQEMDKEPVFNPRFVSFHA